MTHEGWYAIKQNQQNCLLKIIISYLKPYNCVQTNNHWIELFT